MMSEVPAMSMRGFAGRRVEAYLAGMMMAVFKIIIENYIL
jgi:hypothetical protein